MISRFTSGGTLHATLVLDLRTIDWNSTRLSSNDRLHHHEEAKRIKIWNTLAARAGQRVTPITEARIEIWFRFPDNTRREVSNLQPTSKAIVDGLVQQKPKPRRVKGRVVPPKPREYPFVQILPDDSDRYLIGPDNRRDPVNGPHQVVVRIWAPDTTADTNEEEATP